MFVVAMRAKSATELRIVWVESLLDEVHPVEWVVVGHGSLGLTAEDADWFACEYGFAERLMSARVVRISVWTAGLVCLCPTVGAHATSIMEVWTARLRANAECHCCLQT